MFQNVLTMTGLIKQPKVMIFLIVTHYFDLAHHEQGTGKGWAERDKFTSFTFTFLHGCISF